MSARSQFLFFYAVACSASKLIPADSHVSMKAANLSNIITSASTGHSIVPPPILSGSSSTRTYNLLSDNARTSSSINDYTTLPTGSPGRLALDLDDRHDVQDASTYDSSDSEYFHLLASLLEMSGMGDEGQVDVDEAKEIEIALTSYQRSPNAKVSKRDTEAGTQGSWRQVGDDDSVIKTCTVKIPVMVVKQASSTHVTNLVKPIGLFKPQPVCDTYVPIQQIEVIHKPVEGLQQVEGINRLVTPVTTLTAEQTLYAGVDGVAMTPTAPKITQTYIVDNRKPAPTSGSSGWMVPSFGSMVKIVGAAFVLLMF